MVPDRTRRSTLLGLGTLAAGASLAGCASPEDDGDAGDDAGAGDAGGDAGDGETTTAGDGETTTVGDGETTTAGDGETTTAGDDGGGTTNVEMTDELVFDPEEVTVSAGDTVVWETVGEQGHTVTAYEDEIPEDAEYFASGGYDSEEAARDGYSFGDPETGDIPTGETYERTFEVPGTYEYFCIPHETTMQGVVEVQES